MRIGIQPPTVVGGARPNHREANHGHHHHHHNHRAVLLDRSALFQHCFGRLLRSASVRGRIGDGDVTAAAATFAAADRPLSGKRQREVQNAEVVVFLCFAVRNLQFAIRY